MGSEGGRELEVVKLYYRIGEVAAMAGVEPSVLRHWESEFRGLRPTRAKSGQRVYSQTDVRKVLLIKHLLYVERLTIEGAIKRLRTQGQEPRPEGDPVVRDNHAIRDVLLELRKEIVEFMVKLEQDTPP